MDKYPVFASNSFHKAPFQRLNGFRSDAARINAKFLKDCFGVDVDELARRGKKIRWVRVHDTLLIVEESIYG